MKCSECEHWTPIIQGICSQSVLTIDGELTQQKTLGNYGCTSYSKQPTEMDSRIFSYEFHESVSTTSRVRVTCNKGTIKKDYLLKVRDKIDKMIKGMD